MNDIFLVTSVVKTTNTPWSYIPVRSEFSEEERFQQTLQTISSIRKYHSSAKILVIECSDISQEKNTQLSNLVDYYEQVYHTQEQIRNICQGTTKKGFGETALTLYGVRFLQEKQIPFERLFKICGRYMIDERFDESQYSYEKYTFTGPWDIDCYGTIMYTVPKSLFENYFQNLERTYKFYTHSNNSLERILPAECNPKHLVKTLGVSGYVAVSRNNLIVA
jgi:hypothetical protein